MSSRFNITPLKTRLAPTPSGLLHAGNGVSFILTWCLARAAGGQVLLRIDDLDRARMRRAYLDDIFFTLDWLNLDYDEGPTGVDDFLANYSQHTRLHLYESTLLQLKEKGLLYACTCTRKQIAQTSSNGLYVGTCRERKLPFQVPETAWRIKVAAQEPHLIQQWDQKKWSIDLVAAMGDFVVRRKDGLPAYQIASLVDDLHYGINFIVRGQDLLESTAAQLFLAQQIERPDFLKSSFWHHPLLAGKDGEKLSKSQGAGALMDWREKGLTPLVLYRQAGAFLDIDPERIGSLSTLRAAVEEQLEKKGSQ